LFKKDLNSSERAKYNRIWQRHIKIIASHIESPLRAKYLYINYYALTGLLIILSFLNRTALPYAIVFRSYRAF